MSEPSPEEQQVPPVVYTQRTTGWDILLRWRYPIFALLGIGVLAVSIYYYGTQAFLDFLKEIWPILVGPFIGWYFAKWVVKNLYHPSGRVIVILNVETHTFRCIYVPEPVFVQLEQSGNNVLYHSAGGCPVYLAKDIDLSSGLVDYGWVHQLDAIDVMTREQAYVKWDETLNKVLEENLQLMVHPHIIGLGYARKSMRDHLDGIAQQMGFTEPDYHKHDTVSDEDDAEDLPFPEEYDEHNL